MLSIKKKIALILFIAVSGLALITTAVYFSVDEIEAVNEDVSMIIQAKNSGERIMTSISTVRGHENEFMQTRDVSEIESVQRELNNLHEEMAILTHLIDDPDIIEQSEQILTQDNAQQIEQDIGSMQDVLENSENITEEEQSSILNNIIAFRDSFNDLSSLYLEKDNLNDVFQSIVRQLNTSVHEMSMMLDIQLTSVQQARDEFVSFFFMMIIVAGIGITALLIISSAII